MNDHHLIETTDVTGKPSHTIIPGVRPEAKPEKPAKTEKKASE